MTYARIAINTPVDSLFDYHIPAELDEKLRPGHLVQVPFGTAMQHGIIIELTDTSAVQKTKPVSARLDPRPVLTEDQIALGLWMANTYLAPPGPCLWLMLPPGYTGGRDVMLTLINPDAEPRDEIEAQLIALLRRRGPLRGQQLTMALPAKSWRPAADALAKTGVLAKEAILAPARVRAKVVQTVALAVTPTHIDEALADLAKPSVEADVLEMVAEFDGAFLRTAANKATLDKLVKKNWVRVDENQTVFLTIPRAEVHDRLHGLRKLVKPRHVLHTLAQENGTVDVRWLAAQTDTTLTDLKKLEEAGLVTLSEQPHWRDSLASRDVMPASPPQLTQEQTEVWQQVHFAVLERAAGDTPVDWKFLLHGVTGSGKTEIYLRAIDATLQQGRTALFLVPEIALTPQTLQRVSARFGGRVAVVHSGLSEGERYDTWRRARSGLVQVIVGARSALFTPLPNLGLIILDEEHDPSYKQSPPIPAPYYDARAVAEKLMSQQRGVLIMGSATPLLETRYRADRGDLRLLRLPNRIMGHRPRIEAQAEREGVTTRYTQVDEESLTIDLPPIKVVDMRRELKTGNTSIFSRALQQQIGSVLSRKEQAMLFINRRGQATYVFCRDCGYVANCPRCETPLTHHRQGQALRCHRCGFQQAEPQKCPQCQSQRIKFFGAGTQQVEQALHELFPEARTLRWDADTADSPAAHEAILQRFIDRRADIVVGTQMIAKGLDLPLVTLVGVVSADMGLALPDFRATERTFQVLTQVAGRAGRGLLGGQVILQTYQPDHYVIRAASGHDYETFYKRELSYRRQIGYPPYRRLVRILFRQPNESRAQQEAEHAAEVLRARLAELNMTGTELIGPAPCFFTRVNDVFRWQILLRGPDPSAALRGIEPAKSWFIDVDPAEVL